MLSASSASPAAAHPVQECLSSRRGPTSYLLLAVDSPLGVLGKPHRLQAMHPSGVSQQGVLVHGPASRRHRRRKRPPSPHPPWRCRLHASFACAAFTRLVDGKCGTHCPPRLSQFSEMYGIIVCPTFTRIKNCCRLNHTRFVFDPEAQSAAFESNFCCAPSFFVRLILKKISVLKRL